MIVWFKRKKKEEFKNRLKYGRAGKIDYSPEGLLEALMMSDDKTAESIVTELVKQKLLGK